MTLFSFGIPLLITQWVNGSYKGGGGRTKYVNVRLRYVAVSTLGRSEQASTPARPDGVLKIVASGERKDVAA